jgi:hypothetical protein
LSKQGCIALFCIGIFSICVICRVVCIFGSSTNSAPGFSALNTSLSGTSTGGISGFDSAGSGALNHQGFNSTGRDFFGISEVLAATATEAITLFDVVHLVRIKCGIFDPVWIEIITNDDRSVDRECACSKGIEGTVGHSATVDFATIWHGDSSQLRAIQALRDAIYSPFFAVLLCHGSPSFVIQFAHARG